MHDMGSAEIIFRFLITLLRIALCRLLLARFPVARRQKGRRPLVILSDYTVGRPQGEFQFREAIIVRHSANLRVGTVRYGEATHNRIQYLQ